jgi:hypothetical protein
MPKSSVSSPERCLFRSAKKNKYFKNVVLHLIDYENHEIIRRLRVIDRSTSVKKWMIGDPMNISELKSFAKGGKGTLVFGVYREKDALAGNYEKLQGWIQYYPDHSKRIKRLIKQRVIKKYGKRDSVLEVSFAKYPWAKKGQMKIALTKACQLILKSVRQNNKFLPRKVYITAYADIDNVKSVNILESCGFVRNDNKATDIASYILDQWRLSRISKSLF